MYQRWVTLSGPLHPGDVRVWQVLKQATHNRKLTSPCRQLLLLPSSSSVRPLYAR